jgi:hypothetical protein
MMILDLIQPNQPCFRTGSWEKKNQQDHQEGFKGFGLRMIKP